MKVGIVIFLCVLILSCSSNLPNGILEQEKMENILWEQMQADAFVREFVVKDTSKKLVLENIKIQQKIFAKYNTNKETFYKSYEYYLQHTEVFKSLIDSIVNKQTRIKQEDFLTKMRSEVKQNWNWLKALETKKDTLNPYKLNGIIIVDTAKSATNVQSVMPYNNYKRFGNRGKPALDVN